MVLTAVAADGESRRSRPARSDEQVIGALAGHEQSGLAVTLGGEPRYIAPLKIKAERIWKNHVSALAGQASGAVDALEAINTNEGLVALLSGNLDDVVGLVVGFDLLGSGTLNREWLEENATGIEIRDTLEVLLDSVYPPIPGVETRPARLLLALILAGAAARSVSAGSTNASSAGTRGSTARRTSKRP